MESKSFKKTDAAEGRARIPCILFEDGHLLAVHKPAGIATHRPADDAPWGVAEFLSSRRPDLPTLGIHQRLDRETSGVLLFAKTSIANRSLAAQFEGRRVQKTYLFAAAGTSWKKDAFTAAEPIEGKEARTRICFARNLAHGLTLWEARPETGRTHQVRLHAAAHGLPIVGDPPKDGQRPRGPSPALRSEPLLLHALRLKIAHPLDGKPLLLEAPLPAYFEYPEVERRRLGAAHALRRALLDEHATHAYRLIHREADAFPRLTVDRLGAWLYIESYETAAAQSLWEPTLGERFASLLARETPPMETRGVVFARVQTGTRREDKRVVWGSPPPPHFTVLENGIRYHLEPLGAGGTGLFLDQRENRRMIRSMSIKGRVLNLFAYTCGFSVAAAAGGASTLSVDLSRRALEQGRANFSANGIDPARHQFWSDDAFNALRRLAARGERFQMAVLDPPSSSRSKTSGHFSARRDFTKLVESTAPLIERGGWLLCSTNLAEWKPAAFEAAVREGIRRSGKEILQKIGMPQPFDFPITPTCPAHLKSIWLQL